MAALVFGGLSGILEGLTYLGLDLAGLLPFNIIVQAVDVNILWASPLVNVPLFLLVGLCLLPFLPLFRRHAFRIVPLAIFGMLMFYSVISVPGWLRERGALLLALGLGVVLARRLGRGTENPSRRARQLLVPVLVALVAVTAVGVAAPWISERAKLARLAAPKPDAPNVLLVVMDTLRCDRLATCGGPSDLTPFLNELNQRSISFERAFANAPWTLPSHVSMFTGRPPEEHGATIMPYDGRYPTLAETLTQHGYVTVGFVSNNFLATEPFGMARGFIRWENIFTDPLDAARRTLFGRKIEKFVFERYLPGRLPRALMTADEISGRFLGWLDRRPDRPFFAFLNYMEMHLPSEPPPETLRRFGLTPGEVNFEQLVEKKNPEREEIEKLQRLYDSLASHLDSRLRMLFDELARRGADRDLLVIVASDHGESLGERGVFGHRNSLYLEQIRVPLMIRWPAHLPEAARVPQVVGLDQIPPTVAELVGISSHPFPTPSLAACFQNTGCADRPVFSHVLGATPNNTRYAKTPIEEGSLQSVVSGRWHYILQENGKEFLFDWEADPREERNLAADPGHAEMRTQLHNLLKRQRPLFGRPKGSGP